MTISIYISNFKNLVKQTYYSFFYQCLLFRVIIVTRKKLKNNVKNKFIRYDYNIKNMNNFIKISIEFDDIFYEKITKKHYDSREKLNIYVKISKFCNNNNKNQRNDINYEITSIKLNVTMRRKKTNFKIIIIINKNCVINMINRVISYENIRRAIIYDVENSRLYSNIYSQNKKIEKS